MNIIYIILLDNLCGNIKNILYLVFQILKIVIAGREMGMASKDYPFEWRKEEQLKKITVGERKPHNAPITLEEYNSNWPKLYEAEAQKVRSVLGDKVLQLEHVGSTSVPGLCAKPIIDMLLVVENSADESAYVPFLEEAGYTLRIREPDWYEHRLFKGPNTDINLHVFSKDAEEIARMLRFRDWLRKNKKDRDKYAETKRRLAQRVWRHVQHYADAKTAVIQDILDRAELGK